MSKNEIEEIAMNLIFENRGTTNGIKNARKKFLDNYPNDSYAFEEALKNIKATTFRLYP